MNFSVVSKYKLQQIKKIDICCLGIYFKIDGRLEYLNTDVLLYILSFLDIIDLSNLSKTSKNFYGLCQCNYVWGPKIFVKDEDAFEKIMDIIYKNNVQYFPNYFYFKHYFGIIYDIDKKPNEYNYLDLFKNIINLAPDLCAPYYHKEIISDIKKLYGIMIQNDHIHEEFLYVVKATEILPNYDNNNYIWKFEKITNECILLLILKKNRNGGIKLQKIIKPYYIPVYMIKKMKMIFYPETIKRLFG